jgi:hypothetical protein
MRTMPRSARKFWQPERIRAMKSQVGEAIPPFDRRPATFLRKCDVGFLTRGALPDRTADLRQPWLDHLVATVSSVQRGGSFACSLERRYQDLVELLASQRLGHVCSLTSPAFGQSRVIDVQSVDHPLGFAVSHQNDLHPPRR